MDGWINSMWPSHTAEYDTAMERGAGLTRAAVWLDPERRMLSERGRRRRSHSG